MAGTGSRGSFPYRYQSTSAAGAESARPQVDEEIAVSNIPRSYISHTHLDSLGKATSTIPKTKIVLPASREPFVSLNSLEGVVESIDINMARSGQS